MSSTIDSRNWGNYPNPGLPEDGTGPSSPFIQDRLQVGDTAYDTTSGRTVECTAFTGAPGGATWQAVDRAGGGGGDLQTTYDAGPGDILLDAGKPIALNDDGNATDGITVDVSSDATNTGMAIVHNAAPTSGAGMSINDGTDTSFYFSNAITASDTFGIQANSTASLTSSTGNAQLTAPAGSAIISAAVNIELTASLVSVDSRVAIVDDAARPPLNVTERSTPPTAPALHDIYLDDGTNTASASPGWRRWDGVAWEDVGAIGGGGGVADLQGAYNGGPAIQVITGVPVLINDSVAAASTNGLNVDTSTQGGVPFFATVQSGLSNGFVASDGASEVRLSPELLEAAQDFDIGGVPNAAGPGHTILVTGGETSAAGQIAGGAGLLGGAASPDALMGFARVASDTVTVFSQGVLTGVGGTYPTGFTGGETIDLTIGRETVQVVFTAAAQNLADVITEINADLDAAGLPQVGIATNSGGELELTAPGAGPASFIEITGGTALATLGLSIASSTGGPGGGGVSIVSQTIEPGYAAPLLVESSGGIPGGGVVTTEITDGNIVQMVSSGTNTSGGALIRSEVDASGRIDDASGTYGSGVAGLLNQVISDAGGNTVIPGYVNPALPFDVSAFLITLCNGAGTDGSANPVVVGAAAIGGGIAPNAALFSSDFDGASTEGGVFVGAGNFPGPPAVNSGEVVISASSVLDLDGNTIDMDSVGAFTLNAGSITLTGGGVYTVDNQSGIMDHILQGGVVNAFRVRTPAADMFRFDTNGAGGFFGNAAFNPPMTFLGTGQITVDPNMDLNGGIDVLAGAFTFAGTNIDLDPTGLVTLDMDAGQTVDVNLADALTNAMVIGEAGLDYLTLDTQNNQMNIGVPTALDDDVELRWGDNAPANNQMVSVWNATANAWQLRRQGAALSQLTVTAAGALTLQSETGQLTTVQSQNAGLALNALSGALDLTATGGTNPIRLTATSGGIEAVAGTGILIQPDNDTVADNASGTAAQIVSLRNGAGSERTRWYPVGGWANVKSSRVEDPCVGEFLSNHWDISSPTSGSPNLTPLNEPGGLIEVATDAANNADVLIIGKSAWMGEDALNWMRVVARIDAVLTNVRVQIGLIENANLTGDHIYWQFDSAVDASNWRLIAQGSTGSVDQLYGGATADSLERMQIFNDVNTWYYMQAPAENVADGIVLTAAYGDAPDSTDNLYPFLYIQTTNTTAKSMSVAHILAQCEFA